MEELTNDTPKLEVETVQVRRNSSSLSTPQIQQPCESVVERLHASDQSSVKEFSEAADDTEKVLNESGYSESQFGVMETISLDLTVHEAPSQDSAKEISADTVIEVSASIAKADVLTTEPSTTNENVLSKYFGSNPSKQPVADPEGANFFNALSEGVAEAEFNHSGGGKDLREIPVKSSEETSHQPALSKFFAEEKSGNDLDGKAFFEKIADVKETENFPHMEIKEAILNTNYQDSFLLSATNGEIEDAWLPSERTRQMLVNVITSKPPVHIDKSHLTYPSIVVDKDMFDPVKSLLEDCHSPIAQQRKTLTVHDVSVDEAGLEMLMEKNCYHAAINLTRRILQSYVQSSETDSTSMKHTPQSLRIWYVRLALFVKLRKFNLAEAESAAFGDLDKPDLYYEYYPEYQGKRGTMVPFALRLLLAELPQYQGNHQIALDNLYKVLNIIQKVLNNVKSGCAEDGSMIELSESRRNASLTTWSERERKVLHCILNCVLELKDYVLAVSIVNILIEKTDADKSQLLSSLGRIYLQLGDIQSAQECFTKAEAVSKDKSEDFIVEYNINNALLAVAESNCEDALKYYEQAYALNPTNAMLANNMAVCLLYMGKLKSSLDLLEKSIQENPALCIHDGLLFNICTLYELESSRCAEKKVAMLELVSKYAGDSFNVSCLKIQASKA